MSPAETRCLELFARAQALQQQGQVASARQLYQQILDAEPHHFDALNAMGVLAAQSNELQLAIQYFDRAIAVAPNDPGAHVNRGNALKQLRQPEAALASFDRAIALDPNNAIAYYSRAETYRDLGRLEEALAGYEKAVAINPAFVHATYRRGVLLQECDRPSDAIASYDQVIRSKPDHFNAHVNRALLLFNLGRHEEALASCEAVVALRADQASLYMLRGNVLRALDRPDAALADYDRAISINPNDPQAHCDRGMLLLRLRKMAEAMASFESAIAIQPDYAEAYLYRGMLLRQLRKMEEAMASFDRAIAIRPDYADAYFHRGCAQGDRLDWEAAIASFDRAIAIKPDYIEAYSQRGYMYHSLKRFDAAKADYSVVASLAPGYDFLSGSRLETDKQTCDWSNFDALLEHIAAGAENGARVSHPFIFMALTDSARLQQKVARTWVSYACPADDSLGPIAPRSRTRKLTIGYFSADFQEHPVGRLVAELIEIHDRSRFEVIAFSFGPRSRDELQQRLMRAFDRFIEVAEKSDVEIAALARSLDVDIAVDLSGHTFNNRLGIFALRAAPVQVSYLGYLGTVGAGYIDYIVADRMVVTPQTESYYDEKIIYLPDSHQANDRKRRIADKVFTREELGLPPKGFVFCCFNASYKLVPKTFAGWMRILKAVPGSVLLLYAEQESTQANLRAQADRHGVDSRRLVFGERLPPAEYLARYRAADLFLDTFPYNAGTTASDALWAGLPVLTLTGEAFVSRTASSLLAAIGVPELIASTQQQYEQLAIELASNPQRLAEIRAKIQNNRRTSPLFDTPRFARNLEAAYKAIYDRYQAGLAPDHIRL
jgi:protein O-GlcNAc transferase